MTDSPAPMMDVQSLESQTQRKATESTESEERMKEIINLNKCPFCRARSIDNCVSIQDLDSGLMYVLCLKCGARGPEKPTEELAAKAWNEARQGEIEHLTAESNWWHEQSKNATQQLGNLAHYILFLQSRLSIFANTDNWFIPIDDESLPVWRGPQRTSEQIERRPWEYAVDRSERE